MKPENRNFSREDACSFFLAFCFAAMAIAAISACMGYQVRAAVLAGVAGICAGLAWAFARRIRR